MANEPDDWYYPRPEIAQGYLRAFNPGPAEALTLFAERRSGKTTFLRHDLSPEAIKAGLQPVLIDLWATRSDPGKSLADGLETAARQLANPEHKGRFAKLLNTDVTNIGAAGFSIGLGSEKVVPPLQDNIGRIGFWTDQMVAASKRPILLMVDEVQAIAKAPNSIDVSSALRSALQKHGRKTIQPIFTGSSRDELDRIFAQSNAAFFRYGSQPDFPMPDAKFVDFMAEKFKAAVPGSNLDRGELLTAFEKFDHRPGPFRDMMTSLVNREPRDIKKEMQVQLGELYVYALAAANIDKLTPLDHAILEQLAVGGSPYTAAGGEYLSQRAGQGQTINNRYIRDSLDKMRELQLVRKEDRGSYLIEDRDVGKLIAEQIEAMPVHLRPRALPTSRALPQLPAPASEQSSVLPLHDREIARAEATNHARPNDQVFVSKASSLTSGEVIGYTDNFLLQRSGNNTLVAHPRISFEKLPAIGDKVTIRQHASRENAAELKAQVVPMKEKTKGKGIER